MNNGVETDEKPSPVRRITTLATLLLVSMHFFATVVWVAPPSALKELFPNDSLQKYMYPLFNQAWSVFAPTPVNADYYFDVRAVRITSDGEDETTEWVRASNVEYSRLKHNLFPPRSTLLSDRITSDMRVSWKSLNSEQKTVVNGNYYLEDNPRQRLEKQLSNYGSEKAGQTFMKVDEVATSYATQVALAVWGDGVQRVQYRTSQQRVKLYDDRNDSGAKRPEIQYYKTGWRALLTQENQSQEKFERGFCSAPLRVCENVN